MASSYAFSKCFKTVLPQRYPPPVFLVISIPPNMQQEGTSTDVFDGDNSKGNSKPAKRAKRLSACIGSAHNPQPAPSIKLLSIPSSTASRQSNFMNITRVGYLPFDWPNVCANSVSEWSIQRLSLAHQEPAWRDPPTLWASPGLLGLLVLTCMPLSNERLPQISSECGLPSYLLTTNQPGHRTSTYENSECLNISRKRRQKACRLVHP